MKNFMLFLMTLFLSCHVMAQQTTVTAIPFLYPRVKK